VRLTTGQEQAITLDVDGTPFRLLLHDQEVEPGIHLLTAGGDTLAAVALNLSRKESDLAAYSAQELQERIEMSGLTTFRILSERPEHISRGLRALDEGRPLWKWFVLLALLFLVTEAVLLRLWK
jgi:hypothetical protein